MSTPYSAKAVANYFLELSKSKRIPLSPMKLQKMIYFAHGWHLALYGIPLIDEEVQAWRYGPVISSVYHEFKRFGGGIIDDFATDIQGMELYRPSIPEDDARTRALLDRVWDVYGKFSGVQLSNLTHEPETPWDAAWNAHDGMLSVGIDNEAIKSHFATKTKKKQDGAGTAG